MDRSQIAGTLRRAREAREATFLDTCTITRPAASAPTISRDTGAMTAAAGTTVYSGACSIRQQDFPTTPDRDDTALTVRRLELKVPVSAASVSIGDVATITATLDDASAWMLGRWFRVVDRPAGTFLTDQRLVVEEVVADG